ncbi:Triosephosphate isomerase, partial [Trachymyrmex cornetzi]
NSFESSQRFALGAQNVSEHFEFGPYTGQINSRMLFDLGCKYSIVGHSECRNENSESDLSIPKKACSLLKSSVIPIICIGESMLHRIDGTYMNEILDQLQGSIQLLNAESVSNVIIAYEPLWSIGSGNIPNDINEVATVIKNNYTGIKFLYGGSVNSTNIEMLSDINSIDGVLVGNASLDACEFTKIIRVFSGTVK